MAVIKANRKSRSNWKKVVKIIRGLEYSYEHNSSGNKSKYSLDEKLRGANVISNSATSRICSAEDIVDCIGKDVFKQMIENIWNKEIYAHKIPRNTGIHGILWAFDWERTSEGWDYWDNIEDKLLDLEDDLGIHDCEYAGSTIWE